MSEPLSPEVIIFNAALELPQDRRAAYLDKACAGNETLRSEVEALLAAEAAAEQFLAESAASIPTVAALTEKTGDVIGRYKLLQQIGEGGCGVVYMAEQQEPVRRRVALKIIKLGMDTKQVIARFEAERQALALMDHPNIAKALDAGATETGRPFFVMELVRGPRITEYCDQRNLSTRERLELFVEICRAVQHAHQKGIIHRDLKPSNILVTVNDGVAVPKVIDFGIAKATAELRLTEKTLFTAFEQFIGTPAYMSPEQAEMTSLDIDTRSDIYSLGVLLYELLTGKTPFDQKELFAVGLEAMRRTIRETEPQRPSTRLSAMTAEDLTETARRRQTEAPKLIHQLRGDLDWMVMKALEKDRARRYETANGFGTDILRFLNNEPVSARPPSGFYRLRKAVRRNRLAVTMASIVALTLVFGAGFSTRTAIKERRARERSDASEKKAEMVAKFLKDMLEGVGPSVALGRDTTILREILDKTAERVGKELTNQPSVEVEIRNVLGEVYRQIGRSENAAAMHRQAAAVARRSLGPNSLQEIDSLNSLGAALYKMGKLDESEKILRDVIKNLRASGATNTLEMSNALIALSSCAMMLSRMEEAGNYLENALLIHKKILPPDHAHTAIALNNLGNVRQYQGRLDETERHLTKALEINRRLRPPVHPEIASNLHNLAALVHNRGNLAAAEKLYEESMAMYQKIYGAEMPEHSVIVLLWHNLAAVMRDARRFEEAEKLELKVLEVFKRPENARPPDTLKGRCLAMLASIAVGLNKLPEAESWAQQGVDFSSERFGEDSVPLAASLVPLARVLQKASKLDEAEKAASKSVDIFQRKLPNSWAAGGAKIAWGSILLEQKRFEAAEAPLRAGVTKYFDARRGLHIAELETLTEAMEQLAQLYEQTNRSSEAASWRQKGGELPRPN